MLTHVTTSQQITHYYNAVRMAGEVNLLFLDLVKDGLTREELAINIERRPGLWQRFETWLDHLPTLPANLSLEARWTSTT